MEFRPQRGDLCVVQFKRDLLGIASERPISPMVGSFQGTELMITGRFLKMDRRWIVLEGKHAGQELWVPRNNILLMSSNSP